jgi:CO/xanthine dehydrogenase Mo-binding subunit
VPAHPPIQPSDSSTVRLPVLRDRLACGPQWRIVVAHDCGLVVNPDGLRNQFEGNVVQGVSRTLKEEVKYTADRITSVVWQSSEQHPHPQYDVIRFNEVPAIETILLDHPDKPAWGAGEPTIGTVPGAIGNAVFAATGCRIRTLPLTPERVKAALAAQSAGKSGQSK